MRSQSLTDPAFASGNSLEHALLKATASQGASSLRIGYSPFELDGNDYVARMQQVLSELGQVQRVPALRHLLRRPYTLGRKPLDVIILNWHDSKLAARPSGRLSLSGLAKFIAEVVLYRLMARRVVFVRHNRYPHHASAGSGKRIGRWLDRLEPLFDMVVSHSGHDQAAGRHYVPHPLYRFAERPATAAESDYHVVFGRVLRYKNILSLVQAYPADRRLVIAGPCHDQAYLTALRSEAEGKRIEFMPGFMSAEAAQQLLLNSRGSIICHADEDMIVSGSYFFAASLGVPVLAVRTPFFDWLTKDVGANGLQIADDIPGLLQRLDEDQVTERAALLDEANRLFGDQAVAQAWQNGFARLGLIEQPASASL